MTGPAKAAMDPKRMLKKRMMYSDDSRVESIQEVVLERSWMCNWGSFEQVYIL